MLGAVQEKTAEEKFKREELEGVHQLPAPKVRPERFAGRKWIERISHLKMIVRGHETNQGKHDGQHERVHPEAGQGAFELEPIVAQPYLEQKVNHQHGNRRISQDTGQAPEEEPAEGCRSELLNPCTQREKRVCSQAGDEADGSRN